MRGNIYNKVLMRTVMMAILVMMPFAASAKKQKQLLILHTNDTHSCIYPLNPNLDNKDLAGRGGFLRRINMIKEERQKNPRPSALR